MLDLFSDATGVSVSQSWFTARSSGPRLASIAIHGVLLVIASIPWASSLDVHPKFTQTAVALHTLTSITLPGRLSLAVAQPGSGGGGGGKHQPLPASRGELPRGAEKQFVPPDPEPPKNPDPLLIMEPTIVAPELALLRLPQLLNIGDPAGVPGPPSSGPGDGGGIGGGHGRGDGDGDGPGAGKGSGGGCCEGTYRVGGGVSGPAVVYRIEPEYSEDARKARQQGTVVLQALIRRDGSVDVVHVVRSIGFGLDQNAIDALKQWRFRPATRNGQAIDFTLNVEVRFTLR